MPGLRRYILARGFLVPFPNSCKQHNRGYRADKSYLECRNCQVEIPYEDLKTGIGGCYPIPIHGKEENGIYSIPLSEILKGREFFP
ncbi:MAG: DUF2318 domain-containing protein [Nitrospirae bacterium]|nr:DUF2318 domain-containing protein [Nitrospirota bacterium]